MKRHPFSAHKTKQGDLLECVICHHTWTSLDANKVREAQKSNKDGPYCYVCLYLEMARRHSNARGKSLKRLTKRYLRGVAKRTGQPFQNVWTMKS